MVAQSVISYSPDSLNVTLSGCNDSITLQLTIYNTGSADLDFDVLEGIYGPVAEFGFAYITNASDNSVSVFDVITNTLVGVPIPVGTFPWRVTIKPDGKFVYVSNRGSNNITVIRTSDNTVTATIPVGTKPTGLAFTPDGNFAYVGNRNSDNVMVIDCNTNTVINTITSFGNLNEPQDIVITPDGQFAYVATFGDGVTVIAVGPDTVLVNIPGVMSYTHSIRISADGSTVYVTEGDGGSRLQIIDVATNTLITTISVFSNPHGFDITPDGNYIYVIRNDANIIDIIDVSTNTVINSIADPIFSGDAWGLSISPDGNYAYVTVKFGSPALVIIDINTNTIVGSQILPGNDSKGIATLKGGVPWLIKTPITGTIVPGDSAIIDVTFYASGLNSGTYTTNLYILSNDSTSLVDTIPCTLTIAGAPVLALSDTCLDLDSVMEGRTNTGSFWVFNTGCDTLFVSSMTTSTSEFSPDTNALMVLPNDSAEVIVSFSPLSTGSYTENLDIFSNDVDTSICLSGVGTPSPAISFNPDSFNVTLNGCDDTITQSLTIYNTGAINLDFNISTQTDAPPFNFAYITNGENNTVSVLDLATNTLVGSPIAVGARPWRVSLKPDSKFAYVSNGIEWYTPGNSISVIRTSDNIVTATIPVGLAPTGLAFTPDGNYAYVGNRNSNSVMKIDCNTNTVVNTITGGLTNPMDVAITPDGQYAYVATKGSGVAVIDISTDAVITNIAGITSAYSIVITPDGAYAYVTQGDRGTLVYVIDLATNTIETTISGFSRPHGLDVTRDGSMVWVADYRNDRIVGIDVSTNSVVNSIADFRLNDATGLALSQDGNTAYVTRSWNTTTLLVVDLASGIINPDFDLPGGNSQDIATSKNGMPWLSTNPVSGSVPINDSIVINVEFNGAGLNSGTYTGDIIVNSNDPNSPHTVPVTITINGYPMLALSDSCLYLDSIMEFTTSSDTLLLYNTGCDTLFITNITNSTPEYSVDTTSLIILPGDSGQVIVTFAPTSAGFFQDTINVFSNDINPAVCLSGYGYLSPTIATDPDSFNVTIASCCDSTTELLTIYNTGLSDLIYTIGLANYDSTILIIYTGSGTSTDHVFTNLITADSILITVTLNGDYDNTNEYADLYIDGDFIEQINDGNLPNGTDIIVNYAFGGAQVIGWLSDGQITVTLDNSPAVNDFVGTEVHQVQLIINPPAWIRIPTLTDTIVPNDSAIVNVQFISCGTNAGTYSTNILITSNDPLNSPDTVPVTFTVVGTAEIVLSDTCLYLDSIMEFTTFTDSFTIYNIGCDTLFITDANNSLPEFSLSDTVGYLMPGDSMEIIVTFSPTSADFFLDTINIFSNDINPVVCLSGYSYLSPILATNPDPFDVTINSCCDSTTASLWIYNNGGTDLYINDINNNSIPLLFYEPWESGTYLPTWTTGTCGFTYNVDTINSAVGNYNMEMIGGCGTLYQGLRHNFGVDTPSYVSFYIKAAQTNRYSGYVLTGLDPIAGQVMAWFYMRNNGMMGLATPSVFVPYVANQWYQIEYRNINYVTQTFDFYIDDVLISGGHGFRDFITNLEIIHLFNYNSSTTWYDEIVFGEGAPGQEWLEVYPITDTIVPNDSSLFNVTFNSCGLNSGIYTADIIINSNDPLNSQDTIPVMFTVVGSPEITFSDSCLYLDSIMEFATFTDSFTIYNTGCDTLFITNINNSFSEFSLSDTTGIIPLGDSMVVYVTFSPTSAGFFQDTITIFNNDVDTSICLSGYGFARPIISTDPDTFDITIVACCDSITDTLIIYNTGGSDLIFDVNSSGGGGASEFFDGFESGDIATWIDEGGLYTKQVTTFNPATGSYALEMNGGNGTNLNGISHTFSASTPDYIGFKIKSSTNTQSNSYVVIGDNPAAWNDGIIYIHLNWNGNIFVNPIGNVIPYNANQWYFIEMQNIDFASKTYDLYIDGNLEASAVSFPDVTETSINEVHLYGYTAGQFSYFDDIAIGDPVTEWLTFNSATDTILPVDSTIINVTFNSCGLNSGIYTADIIINSNDPLNSQDTIPVTFIVVGAPEIVLSDTCLYLDSIMEFTTFTDSFTIYNTGCDTLFITDINNSLSEFSLSDTTGVILIGDSMVVYVVFAPTSVDFFQDTITIFNNDVNTSICLSGYGFARPVISFDPDSFDVALNGCCDSTTLFLTVYNTGGSDLFYNISSGSSWITLPGSADTVPFNDSSIVNITFNGCNLLQGTYSDSIVIMSNDPLNSQVVVFVTITKDTLPPTPFASDTAICFGDITPTFVATGDTLTGDTILWYSDPALTVLVDTGDTFTPGDIAVGSYTYYLTLMADSCQSLPDSVTLTINSGPGAPIAIDTGSCFGDTVPPLIATGGTLIQWYDDAMLTNLVFTGDTFPTGNIAAGSYLYYATDSVAGCSSGPSDTVTLTISSLPAAPVASDTSVCEGDTVPDLTASGTNIQWYDDPGLTSLVFTGDSFATGDTLAGVYTYYATQTVSGCESTADSVTLTINVTSPPTSSDTTICFSDPTPDLIATGTSIQWYSDPALTVLEFSGDTFASGDVAVGVYVYYATQTLNGCESPAVTVTLTINSGPAAPSSADTAICFGDPTPDLTATGTYLQWYDDAGLTNMVFTGSPFATGEVLAGTYVYYVTDSITGCPEGPSNTVTLTINVIPSAPVSSDTTICFGNPTPDLSATGSNILWYSDPGLITLVFSGNPFASGDVAVGVYTYYATQTVNNCESPSTTVTLTINDIPPAPVSTDTTICFGDPTPDLTATGTFIQWYNDGGLTNLVFTGSPYATGDTAAGTYTYYVTDSITGCPLSPADTVTITINALPPIPIASDTTICYGDTVPDLIASGDSIQWYSDPGLAILVFSGDTFATGDTSAGVYTYYATQTVSGCESTSDTVTLTINVTPPPTSSDTTICFGDPTPDLIAVGSNIQWYSDPALTVLEFSGDTFASGDVAVSVYVYYATQTLNGCESPAVTVTLTINPGPAAPSSADTDICFGDPTPDLTATGTYLQWYDDAGLTNLVFTGSPFATGEVLAGTYIYYVTDSITGCLEGPSNTVTLTINAIPPAPASSDTIICFGNPTPDLTATGSNIRWYDDPALTLLVFSGNPFATGETAVGTYIYYTTQTVNNCESPSITVTVTINGIPSTPVSSDSTICFGDPTPDLTATGTYIQWYDDGGLTNLVFAGSPYSTGDTAAGVYTYYVTDSVTGCPQSPSDTVTITINALPSIPVASDTTICYGDTVPDLIAAGDSIRWYSDPGLTTLVFSGDTFATGDTSAGVYVYYTTQTDLATLCESPSDTIILTINATSAPLASDAAICSGDPVPDLTATGTNIQWYNDSLLDTLVFTGNPFSTGDSVAGIYTYYVTQTLNNCESPATTVTLSINAGASVPASTADTAVCFGDPTPDLIAAGTYIQWYDDGALTNLVFSGDTFATGETTVNVYTYYVTDSVPGCAESAADTVTLTIYAIPSAPTASDTASCFGDPTADLVAAGTNIQWYSDPGLTILVFAGDTFASGDTAVGAYTYYTTQTVNNCESSGATVTLTINVIPATPSSSDTTICVGDPTPDLAATGTNIKWYDDAGLTNLVFTGSPFATGDTAIGVYIYYVTDSAAGCTSPTNTVILTIGGLPLIALSDTCMNLDSTIEFTTNTDTLLIFNTGCDTLFITNITNSSGEFGVDTTSLTILPGDTGQIIVSFSPTSDTSFTDTLNIFSNDVDVSVCLSGTGLGAPVIVFNPDTFNVSFTGCCDSTISLLTVYNNGVTGAIDLVFNIFADSSWISFSIPADTVAQGDSTTLNVIFNGCGLNPGIYTANITINSNDPLNPSDTVLVIVVKDSLPSSPVASDMAICFGNPTPDMVAAGTGDSILWYSDPALAIWVFTGDTFATGETAVGAYTYYITSMKDICEGLPDSVTLTINTPPSAPAITDTSVCYGYPTPDLIVAGTFVKWYSDTALTILVFSGDTFPTGDTAVGATTYYVTDSVGGCPASPADTVTLTINPTPAAPTASFDTTICYGDPTPDLIATGAYIRWYDDPGLTSLVFTGDTFATGDTLAGVYAYYVTQTDTLVNNCESFAETVVLTINAIPVAPTVSDTTICFGNPTPDLVASGTYLQWYDDAGLTNLVFTGDTFTTGDTLAGIYTYYVTDSVSACAQSPAGTVTLTINAFSITPAGYDTTICFGDQVPNLTVTGSYIQWYSDTGLTTLVFTGDTFATSDSVVGLYIYYVTDSTGGCPESSADTVTLTINTVPSPPLANDTTICFGDPTPDLTATGVNILWYSDPLLDTLVFSGDTFATGNTAASTYTYYVTQTDTLINNCESPADTVILTINPIPAAPAAIDTTACEGSPIPGLTAAGIFLNWYSDTSLTTLEFSGDTFATGQTVANTYIYYVTQTVSGCESPADTSVLTILPTPLPPTVPGQTGCEGSFIPDLTATGTDIKWYSDPGLTNLVNTGSTYTTGETTASVYTYYVTDSLPQCVSAATTVTLTINSIPSAPTTTDTTICSGTPTPTLTATGINPQWYSDPTLILLVNTGNAYATGETSVGIYTYYVTDLVAGCSESPSDTVTLTINPSPLVTLNTYAVSVDPGDSVKLIAYNANTYTWVPEAGLNTTTGASVWASPDTTTTYTVTGTNDLGCSNSASVIVDVKGTGIYEYSILENLSIYPNPTRDEFIVEFTSSQKEPVVINLRNMLGQIMVTREAESRKGHKFIETFNARQLLPGLYHLEIITKRGVINRKVVVE